MKVVINSEGENNYFGYYDLSERDLDIVMEIAERLSGSEDQV